MWRLALWRRGGIICVRVVPTPHLKVLVVARDKEEDMSSFNPDNALMLVSAVKRLRE